MTSILAIDFGRKRVGIALSTTELNIPQALKTIPTQNLWEELDKIFKTYKIVIVVIGLPLRTDGTDVPSTIVVKKLAEDIGNRFNVPVKLWDERFTTKSAERILHTIGKKPSKNKPLIDKIAAAIILEEYLSSIHKLDVGH